MSEWNITEIDDVNRQAALDFTEPLGVVGEIHPEDFIYWYDHYVVSLINQREHAALRYMQGGRATAHILRDTLQFHPVTRPDFQLLDFAAGFGRVSRFFREVLPAAVVTASDIHPKAVEFLRQTIGVEAFMSKVNPLRFVAPRRYDVVFVLSFFSHLPKTTWGAWLQVLARTLEPGGLLIFSAHGAAIHADLGFPDLDDDGFMFQTVSEQKDLDTAAYGTTVTMFDFVYKRVKETGLVLEGYRASGVGHHDLYVLRSGR